MVIGSGKCRMIIPFKHRTKWYDDPTLPHRLPFDGTNKISTIYSSQYVTPTNQPYDTILDN